MSKSKTKERTSRLEWSFETDKKQFLLNEIKARTEATKRLKIIFGILTSNAHKNWKKDEPKGIEASKTW